MFKSNSGNPTIWKCLHGRQFGHTNRWDMYRATGASHWMVHRLQRWLVLDGHSGCVNTLAWNDSGTLLLSGSDDHLLNIYDVTANKLLNSIRSGHNTNIFNAKFLPCTNDSKIVSCSSDGKIHFNEVDTEHGKNVFSCHSKTVFEIRVTPGDPNNFLSCSKDGTVRSYDLREKTKCECSGNCGQDVLIDCGGQTVSSICVNPIKPWEVAIGCQDYHVRVCDRRYIAECSQFKPGGHLNGMVGEFKPKGLSQTSSPVPVSSLNYSYNGDELLVSYHSEDIYLFSTKGDGASISMSPGTERNKRSSLPEEKEEKRSVKKLRICGDWSDTGPQARPERETARTAENLLMQRMTSLFRLREDMDSEDENVSFDERRQAVSTAAEVVAGDGLPEDIPVYAVASNSSQDEEQEEAAAKKIQSFFRSLKAIPLPKVSKPTTKMKYKGHRNSRTMIKEANFLGDEFVMSGSDCGRVFIWEKRTGELVTLLDGDRHVVNCVQPNPTAPIVATSGIDNDIKIWAPLSPDPIYLNDMEEIVARNEQMNNESADTITIPASYILRMLAAFRAANSGDHRSSGSSSEDD